MESQDIEGQENTWLCQMGQVPELKGKDHWTQKAGKKKKKKKHAQCWRKEERQLQKSDIAGG